MASRRYVEFFQSVDLAPGGTASLDWIGEIQAILGARGIRLGVVVMPWNEAIIRRLSPPADAERYMRRFYQLTAALKAHLAKERIFTLDLAGRVPSHCFMDLFHTNTCGDGILAEGIDQWLRERNFLTQ